MLNLPMRILIIPVFVLGTPDAPRCDSSPPVGEVPRPPQRPARPPSDRSHPHLIPAQWSANKNNYSRNIAVISGQVKLGHQYQLQAIEALTSQGLEAAPAARELAQAGYVQLRLAAGNLSSKLDAVRFKDPLLEYVLERIELAREHNRAAIAKLGEATAWHDAAHLAPALDHLDQVVTTLDEVIILIP